MARPVRWLGGGHSCEPCGRDRPRSTAWRRRRRSSRPGNSQANGPQGDETLESRRPRTRGRLTEGVSRRAPANLSGPTTEGATARPETAGVAATADVGGPFEPTPLRARRTYAALRTARRSGRQAGAVRRLCDAGPVSAGHSCRAPADARAGGALRRLPHGPDQAARRRRGVGSGAAGSGRHRRARRWTHGLYAVRLGLGPVARAPARARTEVAGAAGDPIGVVTSGG